MVNYYVKNGTVNGAAVGSYTVIIHVAIPSANNLAGINYQTIMVAAGLNTTVLAQGSNAWQIDSTDYTALIAGGIYEFSVQVTPIGANTAAIVAYVAALVTAQQAEMLAALQAQYQYWGATG